MAMTPQPYAAETLDRMAADARAVEVAIQAAVRQTLLDHKREGLPAVTWTNGKVVLVPPAEIVVDDEPLN